MAYHRRASESHLGAYAAFAAICVIWGTTFAAIRVAIETIPTLLVGGVRFLIAAVLLLCIAGLRGARFSYAYVNPAIAVLTGALLLHEAVTVRMVASMALILAGVALIQIDRRRAG